MNDQGAQNTHLGGQVPLKWKNPGATLTEVPVDDASPEAADSKVSARVVAAAVYPVVASGTLPSGVTQHNLIGP